MLGLIVVLPVGGRGGYVGEPGITYNHKDTLTDEFLLRIFIHIYIYTHIQ